MNGAADEPCWFFRLRRTNQRIELTALRAAAHPQPRYVKSRRGHGLVQPPHPRQRLHRAPLAQRLNLGDQPPKPPGFSALGKRAEGPTDE